jgi:hypothetical protein
VLTLATRLQPPFSKLKRRRSVDYDFALAVEVKGGLIFLWNDPSRQDFLLTAE